MAQMNIESWSVVCFSIEDKNFVTSCLKSVDMFLQLSTAV